MSAAALDHDPNVPEISDLAAQAIESWQRTLAKAQGDRVPIFREACRELIRFALDHNEPNAADWIFAELDAMAVPAGIRLCEAERIVEEVRAELDADSTIMNAWERQDAGRNGVAIPATIDDTSAIVPTKFITPAEWPDEEPPPIEWLVPNRVQRGDVTTLHGDGGAGKTDIALRLAANVARGAQEWLGQEITATATGHVVFISAEEPERKIRRRLWHHGRHDGYRFTDIAANFHLWCPAKRSGTYLAVPDRYTGIMHPTKVLQEIAAAILDLGPVLVIVDNVAATCGGSQIDRIVARSYVNLWAEIAEGPSRPAVLLIDHPSLSGITNGTGRGGNMDWRNAVRSALWLHSPPDQVEVDRGIRILETAKINDGPTGNPLRLVWAEGGLQLEHAPTSMHRVAKDQECEETFLRLLDEREGQGRHVSSEGRAATYAPKAFADMPNNGDFRRNAFAAAMERLLQSGKLIQVMEGPASRQRGRLVRKHAASA
jgi:RecA-family ATPase